MTILTYRHKWIFIVLAFLFSITSCKTYCQKTIKYQEYILSGDFEKAKQWLDKQDREKQGKNRLLFLMNHGWLNWILGDYGYSNHDFAEDDIIIEDEDKKLGYEALEMVARKATEHKNKDEVKVQDLIPAAITITNAITEKADTRNWQTLPYSISYSRIPLVYGQNTIELKTYAGNHTDRISFMFDGQNRKTIFFTYHSLESQPIKN